MNYWPWRGECKQRRPCDWHQEMIAAGMGDDTVDFPGSLGFGRAYGLGDALAVRFRDDHGITNSPRHHRRRTSRPLRESPRPRESHQTRSRSGPKSPALAVLSGHVLVL